MMTATDHAWDIVGRGIAAVWWHALNAMDVVVCRWANETGDDEA